MSILHGIPRQVRGRWVLSAVFFAVLALVLASSLGAQPPRAGSPQRPARRLLRPPQVTLDPHPAKTDQATVTIRGKAPVAECVIVKVAGQLGERVVEPDFFERFEAEVELVANRLNRIVVTPVAPGTVYGPARETTVLQDSAPPKIVFESPRAGETVTSTTISAYGRVEDATATCGLTVEFLGATAVTTVNRGTAGRFAVSGAQLRQDPDFPNDPTRKILRYSANDVFDQAVEGSLKLILQAPDATTRVLSIADGNLQNGLVGQELPVALGVQLSGPGEHRNRVVTFRVSSGGGGLATATGGPTARRVQVRSDDNGNAAVHFVLGKKTGAGVHRVTARVEGYEPTVEFLANGVSQSALKLHQASGAIRVGEPATLGARPLACRVTDGNHNGIGGVSVTFRVISGKARFDDGSREATVLSLGGVRIGDRGLAAVAFRFGPDKDVTKVEANFPGNTGPPVVFELRSVRAKTDGDANPTVITGVVRDRAKRPVSGAPVKIEGVSWRTCPTVRTDAQGRYRVAVTESGPATVKVSLPCGLGAPRARGSREVTVIPGRTHRVPTIFVRCPDPDEEDVRFDDTREVSFEGRNTRTAFHYVPGSARLEDGTVPTPGNPFRIRVDELAADKVNARFPGQVALLVAFELVSDAVIYFDEALSFTTPNLTGLAPGTLVDVLGMDPVFGFLEVVGTGKVSEDGSKIFAGGVRRTGYVAVASREARKTTVQGQLDNGFRTTADPCLGFLMFDNLAAFPCRILFDGTQQGWRNYLDCVRLLNQAMEQMRANSSAQRAPLPSDREPFGRLVKIAVQDLFGAKRLLWEDAPPTPRRSGLRLEFGAGHAWPAGPPDGVTFTFLSFEATVHFNEPTDLGRIDPGDAILLDPVELEVLKEEFNRVVPPSYRGAATVEIKQVVPGASNPLLIVEGRVMLPHVDLVSTVTVGNRTVPVEPDGSFVLPGVSVVPGIPIRPLLEIDAVSVDDSLESCFLTLTSGMPVFPVIGGTTDVGLIALDSHDLGTDSLDVTPSWIEIDQGETAGVTALATRADATVEDVTLGLDTVFIGSNVNIIQDLGDGSILGTGDGEAVFSVIQDGVLGIASVSVDGVDKSTTVEGYVQLPDGTAVDGAVVTIHPDRIVATSGSDGFFQVSFVPAGQDRTMLSVTAEKITTETLVGQADGFSVLLEGITDLGVVVMEPANRWVVDASGNFDDASKWSLGVVPGPGDVALIDQPGDLVITIRTAVDVKCLVSAETLRLVFPGSLSATVPLVLHRDLDLSGGRLKDTMVVPGAAGVQLDANFGLSTVDNVTLYVPTKVDSGQRLAVENGITVAAPIFVEATTSSANLELRGSDQTVRGEEDGKILLSGPNQAIVSTSGGRVNFEIGIEGEGRLSGLYDLWVPVVSNVPGGAMRFTGGAWTNRSVIRGEGGGRLDVSGVGYSNDGEIRQVGGRITITDRPAGNGKIVVQDADWIQQGAYENYFELPDVEARGSTTLTLDGALDLLGEDLDTSSQPVDWFLEGTIRDGSLTGNRPLTAVGPAATLDGITVSDSFVVKIFNGALVTVSNDMTLDGTVEVGSTGAFTGILFSGADSWLDGSGTVLFSEEGIFNFISPGSGGTLNVGSDVTIEGGFGIVGSTTSVLTISHGTIKALSAGNRVEFKKFENRGHVYAGVSGTFTTLETYRQTGGTTLVDGVLSAIGGLAVEGGTLQGTGTYRGNLSSSGSLQLGPAAGSTVVEGSYDQTATGDLDIGIGGTTAGSFGALDLRGAASFNGTLTIRFIDGFVPRIGDTFRIMDYVSGAGSFSQILGGQAGQFGLQIQLHPDFLELLVVPN